MKDSPIKVPPDPAMQWRLLLETRYSAEDVLWIGRDPRDSGSPAHAVRFRTAAEWLKEEEAPGAFMCPNTFKPGVSSRSNANLLSRKFIIVESDELSPDEVGAVFKYLQLPEIGLKLKAVTFSGSRSLHAWFVHPGAERCAEIKAAIMHLKCDPAMMNPSQPTRLPGVVREETGAYQQLIYLAQ